MKWVSKLKFSSSRHDSSDFQCTYIKGLLYHGKITLNPFVHEWVKLLNKDKFT